VLHLSTLAKRLANDEQQISALAVALRNFAQKAADDSAIAAVREKLGEEHGITDELLQAYRAEVQKVTEQADGWHHALDVAKFETNKFLKASATLTEKRSFDLCKGLQAKADAISPALKAGLIALEMRHKAWLKLLDLAEKTLRARQWADFNGDAAREAKKALLPRDLKKREKSTVRDLGVEAFKRASYFIAQGHWLLSRFPSGLYVDVLGLCRVVTRSEISETDYSLSPPRYVGVGKVDVEDEAVVLKLVSELHAELSSLQSEAKLLEKDLEQLISGVLA